LGWGGSPGTAPSRQILPFGFQRLIGSKIAKLACEKRSHAGIVFTQWSKNEFLKCGLTAPKIAKIDNFWYKFDP